MKELCFFTNVTPEVWAAIAQAVLSALAIVVSVLLVNQQHKQQQERNARAEADRKRQHLESAFQLVGAVYQVTQKMVTWAQPGGTVPHDRYDLFKMKVELEGLKDAIRQTDYGRFDEHVPIEALLSSLGAARLMIAHLNTAHGLNAPLHAPEVQVIGEMADELGGPVKERLDKLHAMLPK